MSSEIQNDANFWQKMSDLVTTKLVDHDREVTEKRYATFNTKIEEQKTEIDQIKSNFEKIRSSVEKVEKVKGFTTASESQAQLASIREHLGKITQELERINSENHSFRRQVTVALNRREQRDHEWSIRIKNWQCPNSSDRITEKSVYMDLVYPVLQLALDKGDIDSLSPHWQNVIEYTHFMPYKKNSIPTLIFRFQTRNHLYAFMTNKKDKLSEINLRISKTKPEDNISPYPFFPGREVKVQHSMSRLNKALETFVFATGIVSRVKIAGQSICVKPKGDKQPWRKIINPYGSSFSAMFSPMEMDKTCTTSPIETFMSLMPRDRAYFFDRHKQFQVRESDFNQTYTGLAEKEAAPSEPSASATVNEDATVSPPRPNARATTRGAMQDPPAEIATQDNVDAPNTRAVTRGVTQDPPADIIILNPPAVAVTDKNDAESVQMPVQEAKKPPGRPPKTTATKTAAIKPK